VPALLALAASAAAAPTRPAAAAKQPVEATDLHERIDAQALILHPRLIAWRRDFHEHPELGNREVRTAEVIANHLRALGLEVRTGVAHTGVVGVLRGGAGGSGDRGASGTSSGTGAGAGGTRGPVVALRSDMDALPVTEQTGLPFQSTATGEYNGQTVGVMHACGHDMHMAVLMGAAEVLAGLRDELAGTVVFLFQPAEEGPPAGERGGAALMVEEGVLDNPKVDAIFGLHVMPEALGSIRTRPGGLMAAADNLEIVVTGRQTHGAMPWAGVDPVVTASQIVLGLQAIVSRQVAITKAPAVITIGSIHGGNRGNIIPETVTLVGTVRTFDAAVRDDVHRRIRQTAQSTAQAAGATATVKFDSATPVTRNDPALLRRMVPSLQRIAGDKLVTDVEPRTVAEDFACYQEKVPGLFCFLGVAPAGADAATIAALPANHSPKFTGDEAALSIGVRVLAGLAVDYLGGGR
jgi:amidohydrolase